MSVDTGLRSRRRAVAWVAFAAVLLFGALALHRPLVAWFTGKSVGDREGNRVSVAAGAFVLRAALDPDPPEQRGDALAVDVKDSSGKPVEDARVDVIWDMPAMGTMQEMRGAAKVSDEGQGRYRAEFDLPMAGTWTLKTTIHAKQGEASEDFVFTVGTRGLSVGGSGRAASSGEAQAQSADAGAGGEIDHYTCSMHPSVRQRGPGKCPICGMDLIPVTKQQQEQGVVTIDETRRQLIGVRTAPVVLAPMKSAFRAVGIVSYDESSLADVNLKVRGWITKLHVDRTGQRVARGQALFDLYSPELYNAEQDFLLAVRGAMGGGDGAVRVEGLARASRQRLRLLGMSDPQIEQLAERGTPAESVAFAAPEGGVLIEKNVVEGAAIEAGTRVFRIAALSKVWVEAEVYEANFAGVRAGQRAAVTLDYLPGRTYDAKVSYVYPYLDPKTRTGRVRIELANKDLELRPGMYANVELWTDLGRRLQAPAAAVVYTGPRRIVFVDLGQGRFKPKEVQIGSESEGMYEVLAGLEPGDVVATSGVFLIAAEARISTAAKYWESTPEDGGLPTQPSTPSASPSVYTCPMHPEVQSETPGKCPKCGMNLEPKEKAK